MTASSSVRARGVTGLEEIEVVWDGGGGRPLQYPRAPVGYFDSCFWDSSRRGNLEGLFLRCRAQMGNDWEDMSPILERGILDGKLPWVYPNDEWLAFLERS